MQPQLHQNIIESQIVPDNYWRNVIDSTDVVDNMINHAMNVHSQRQDNLILFIGKDWIKQFANKKTTYRGVELCSLDIHAVLLLPKLDDEGNPLLAKIGDKHYLTIKGN